MNIRRIQVASPLTLVVLSACGGSSGGGALSALINGTAINGPLFGARVFLDVADANGNFDGVYNAADDILASDIGNGEGLTDGLGNFEIDTSTLADGQAYRLVVTSDDSTRINYSGEAAPDLNVTKLAGTFTLTAPEPSSTSITPVVTPITTLIAEGEDSGLTPAQVASALGLEGQDLLTLNPFAEDADPTIALQAEMASMQIVTTLEALSAAATGVGIDSAAGADAAVGALVGLISTKNDNGEQVDLSQAADISDLQDNFATELTNTEGVVAGQVTQVNNLKTAIGGSLANVNKGVEEALTAISDAGLGISDLAAVITGDTDDLTPAQQAALTGVVSTFESAKENASDVNDAAVQGDPNLIVFQSEAAFEAHASNASPTGVEITSSSVAEGPLTVRTVGSLSLIDGDDNNVAATYEVDETKGDGSLFEVVSGNVLALKEGEELDFESADHEGGVYEVYIKGTDDGGKFVNQKLSIQSTNVDEAPELTESSASATEDAEFSYNVQVSDPEGDDVTAMSLVGDSPDWLNLNFATSTGGVLTGTPTNDDVGEHVITIRVVDATGADAEHTFTITVTNVNDNPEIDLTGVDDRAEQGSLYSQEISASDVDNSADELTISIKTAPDWVELNGATISGTPGSGDVGNNSIVLTVTDTAGGTSDKTLVVNVANINDAPEIGDPAAASIIEGDAGAANTTENLTGAFDVSDPDTPFAVEALSLSLGDGAINNGDGTFSIDGDYSTLTINSSERTYEITPNESAIDALLEGVTQADVYTITVTDLALETDETTLTVNITGANNEPTITVSQDDLTTLSDGAAGQFVVNLTGTDDEDEEVTFDLAEVSDDNDNSSFVVTDNVLSLSNDVITDFGSMPSGAKYYTVDIVATDSKGATATQTFQVNVSAENTPPRITSIEIANAPSDNLVGIDAELNFVAFSSESVNVDGSFTLTLSNDAEVTMTRDADIANKFTGTYTVAVGEDTEAETVLAVASYDAGSVEELNAAENADPAALETSEEAVAVGSIVVDATAPTASLAASGHTYAAVDETDDDGNVTAAGTITLTGSGLLTLGVPAANPAADPVATGDVSAVLDFTKLTWDVDGGGTITQSFTADDISSATIVDDSTIAITLTEAAKDTLHGLAGFGGATATGGTLDVIDVASGFLKDEAGNISAESGAQLSNASVTYETTAPLINAISVDPVADIYGIGAEIDVTLQLSEVVNPSSGLTLTLTNDATLVFSVNADDASKLVATYTVAADEDIASGQLAVQTVNENTVLDLAGNALPGADEMLADGFTDGLAAVVIDATAPTASISATGHAYNASTGILTIVGSQLDTLGIAVADSEADPVELGDVSSVVDMQKLTWNVDGGGSTTLQMPDDAAASIILTDANTLTITLSDAAKASLHALAGFGGTEATGGTADVIDIATGFITDTAGNESSGLASPVANAEVSLADTTAPTITEITSSTSDGDILGAGDTITFSAAMYEDIKAGSEMTITLSNGATVELTRHTTDADLMTGDYIIDENDDEANDDSPLSIATYSIGTTVDVSGNALASDTTVGDFDNITAHAIDTTPPTASISATGHTYSAVNVMADDGVTVTMAAGTLVLSGSNFLTTGIAEAGDASGIFDATKISWDIDGSGAAPKVFAASDFASIVLTNDTTLTLTLTAEAQADLHARAGFGGADATDGIADAIDIAIGMLADTAGNLSTGLASPVANAEVTLSDATAPTISTVTSSVEDDYTGGVGQVITFSATISEDMSGEDGTITLSLSNNGSVVLAYSDATTLTGDYTIGSEDLNTFSDEDESTLELSITGYTPDVVDVSGNAIATDLLIADFDNITDHEVDTSAPYLTGGTMNADDLVVAFSEVINSDSISALQTALRTLSEVADDATLVNENSNNQTFKIATTSEISAGTIDLGEADFEITDLAGNSATITELEII